MVEVVGTEGRLEVAGCQWLAGVGNREWGAWCLMGLGFQFCKMRRVPGWDGGDAQLHSCTSMWMFLIPSNCTLKNSSDGQCYVRIFSTIKSDSKDDSKIKGIRPVFNRERPGVWQKHWGWVCGFPPLRRYLGLSGAEAGALHLS